MRFNPHQTAVTIAEMVNDHHLYASSFKKNKETGQYRIGGKGESFTRLERNASIERHLADVSVRIVQMMDPSKMSHSEVSVIEAPSMRVSKAGPMPVMSELSDALGNIDARLQQFLCFGHVASNAVKAIQQLTNSSNQDVKS